MLKSALALKKEKIC